MSLALELNLIILVVCLFVGVTFLFSSLRKGIQTTRVILMIMRQGCAETRGKLKGRGKFPNPNQLPAAFGFVMSGAKSAAKVPVRKIGHAIKNRMGRREKKVVEPLSWPGWRVSLVRDCVPYRWLSRMWGKLTHLPIPINSVKLAVYMWWTKTYQCNLDEMRYPLESYKSLSEFFLRPIKDGSRKIDMAKGVVTSPVDGKVLHVGSADMTDLSDVFLEQVKGVTYSLEDFVGVFPAGFDTTSFATALKVHADEFRRYSCEEPTRDTKLQTIVLYLAPGDYHYFHSPAEWKIKERRHFAGNLMPVRPWAVEQVQGLYCMNERVVLNGEWENGYFGYVAVGALNVGSVDLTFDDELCTNQKSSYPFQRTPKECNERLYDKPIAQTRGQLMGDFNLGSTVVLIFESPADFEFNVKAGDTVRVGQRLGCEGNAEPQIAAYPKDGSWPVSA